MLLGKPLLPSSPPPEGIIITVSKISFIGHRINFPKICMSTNQLGPLRAQFLVSQTEPRELTNSISQWAQWGHVTVRCCQLLGIIGCTSQGINSTGRTGGRKRIRLWVNSCYLCSPPPTITTHRRRAVETAGAFLPVAILEHTVEHFLDSVPEVATEERVQQRIHSRVEVGEQEGERRKQRIKVRVPHVVLGPGTA